MNIVSIALVGAFAVAASTPLQHFPKSEIEHLAGPFYAVPSLSSGDTLAVANPSNSSLVYAELNCGKHLIRIREQATLSPSDGEDMAVSSSAPPNKDDEVPAPFSDYLWGQAGADLVCGVGVHV